MKTLQQGTGQLVGWRDPDENREWIAANKSRELTDKTMSAADAVAKFVRDGDLVASGGFGHVRVSMAIIYEIIRQRKKNLILAGKTAVHDCDILVASGCVDRVEVAYSFAHELRGLSPASRRAVESGRCKVVAEISNAGYQWRFLAAMMGLPFIPARNMLGTDTLKKSSAKVVECPFTGRPITLLPACYPDVSFIHVHRCDKFGNAQIDGIIIEDFELSRAARRLIITTEEIVDESVIRSKPWLTSIPFLHVDAVVKVPGGSHPCQMPYMYYFDEEHIGEWLQISRTDAGAQEYFDRYVFGAKDFDEYLKIVGGEEKFDHLRKVEQMKAQLKAPWIK
jgi:acyl CoA:acetate/3-ketoacid CoA transferase alpha subunit